MRRLTERTGRRYRVLLVISNLEYGGAQRQLIELANRIDRKRFEVCVCSLSSYVPLARGLRDREERFHVIGKLFKFDVSVALRLARLLRRRRINVVHSYLFDANIAARVAGRLAGVRVINSERNAEYSLKRIQLMAYRVTSRWVDLILANSRAGAEFNRRMLGHEPARYRVVYNGVDVQRFVPRDAEGIRCELGIGRDERVVGIFASFKPQKNHGLFLRAGRRVLNALPKTRLLLVGDELHAGRAGSDRWKRAVGALMDELGIRDRCLVLGNRHDVERLYCACDVTVVSSWFEGTPNVALESMACGVPVVATNVCDNAYVVPDGRAGFIVPVEDEVRMADRIHVLLSDEERRRHMGRAGREWVEAEFSAPRLARRTEDVYLELLEGKCGTGEEAAVVENASGSGSRRSKEGNSDRTRGTSRRSGAGESVSRSGETRDVLEVKGPASRERAGRADS